MYDYRYRINGSAFSSQLLLERAYSGSVQFHHFFGPANANVSPEEISEVLPIMGEIEARLSSQCGLGIQAGTLNQMCQADACD